MENQIILNCQGVFKHCSGKEIEFRQVPNCNCEYDWVLISDNNVFKDEKIVVMSGRLSTKTDWIGMVKTGGGFVWANVGFYQKVLNDFIKELKKVSA